MEYIKIGKIVNTHGIKGEIRLLSNFKYKEKVFVKDVDIYIGKEKIKETINSYRHHKQFEMITLKGITNINDVLKYKGEIAYIKKDDLKLKGNEYLDEDLIGFNIIIDKRIVGTVVDIRKDTYQKQLVVNKDENIYLVPLVYGIIKDINLIEKNIELENVEGLID